jgi:AcrR family transcriptional regulator
VSDGKAKSRQEAKQETRESLIRAGMSLFSEQGVDLPSLDAICAHAGFTRGAFYVHFKDRDDFLEAVLERVLTDFVTSLLAVGDTANDVHLIIDRFLDAAARGKVPLMGQRRLIMQLTAQGTERAERVQARFRMLLQSVIEQLAAATTRGQQAGTVGTPLAPDLVGLWLAAGALGLTMIADLGVPVPFDRIPASAQELFRIKTPGSDE